MKEFIYNSESLLAHTHPDRDPEQLIDHADLVMSYYKRLLSENHIEFVITNILAFIRFDDQAIPSSYQGLIREMFDTAIYYHDLGKINPVFQVQKMKNRRYVKKDIGNDPNHSLLSSLLYLDIWLERLDHVEDQELCGFLNHIVYVFSYIISRHHTYLENLLTDTEEEQYKIRLEDLLAQIKQNPTYIQDYKQKERLLNNFTLSSFEQHSVRFTDGHDQYGLYFLTRLLYSTLVSSDFYATYDYMNGRKVDFHFLLEKDKKALLKQFQDQPLYNHINEYRNRGDRKPLEKRSMNELRSDIFLEASENLTNHLTKNLFYLEAPTGSGKTNTSLHLALQLINGNEKLNKFFYVFPFNTLVEQTEKSLKATLGDIGERLRISVVNSVTPIIRKEEERAEEKAIQYKEEVLRRQMVQYPITITSNVNFMNYLTGTGREANLGLVHLCNSVIVIDEVQSYRNEIWPELIDFWATAAKLLNLKIIIMSATLPKLDRLLPEAFPEEVRPVTLLPNHRQYFSHPKFTNRVQLHFEWLEEEISYETLIERTLQFMQERKETRLLIEFIKKKSAREFYMLLQERLEDGEEDYPLYELTGDDNNRDRKRLLNLLGKNENGEFNLKNVIVVATQVIEAGVDIDMDVGLKDISILDNEEQFLGRINRSSERSNCHAYFFDLDQAKSIYRSDARTGRDLKIQDYQKMLRSKDFTAHYEYVFNLLSESKSKQNAKWNRFDNYDRKVYDLAYEDVATHLKLIDQKQFSLFLPYEEENEWGESLNGEKLWIEYKSVLSDQNLDYAKKKVKLSQLQSEMSTFVYSVTKEPRHYEEIIGNLYYVNNPLRFLIEDKKTKMKKFDRERYFEENGGLFI